MFHHNDTTCSNITFNTCLYLSSFCLNIILSYRYVAFSCQWYHFLLIDKVILSKSIWLMNVMKLLS